MSEEEIKPIIFQLLKRIAPESDPSALKPDQNIRETLNIDSYDTLQFIVALNEKLGIEIPEQDYGKISTIKTLLEYIKNNRK